MNDYANIAENIPTSITGLQFMQRILSNPEEIERAMHRQRERLLHDIAMLESSDFLAVPQYSRQIELIRELYDYGFEAETIAALKIMEKSMSEIMPSMLAWFNIQVKTMGFKIVKLESFTEKSGKFIATYTDLFAGNCEIEIKASELIEHASLMGLTPIEIESVPSFKEIMQAYKKPLAVEIQEQMDILIRSLIEQKTLNILEGVQSCG